MNDDATERGQVRERVQRESKMVEERGEKGEESLRGEERITEGGLIEGEDLTNDRERRRI